jgi:hypothetical protein
MLRDRDRGVSTKRSHVRLEEACTFGGDSVATVQQRQTERGIGSWSRTRWLVLTIVLLAIAAAVVLIVVYAGGGSGGGGGGGY